MIKIRYKELPAGLHVRAQSRGRSTIIYLVPGLTPAERRAALIRVQRSASMGYGPALPKASVALAVAWDRTRSTLRNGAVAFRAHPLLLLPPVIMVIAATLVYIMTASVTFTVRPPQASGPGNPFGSVTGPAAAAGASEPGRASSSPPSASRPRPAPPRPGTSAAAPAPHSLSPAPSPGPTSSSPPAPSPTPSPTSPSPAPSPSPASTHPCLNIGPVGICLGS